jgi:hypothetical protein
MKRKVQISLFLLLAAVFSAFGQALPALPKASEITVGTLPDNVSYYLVNNTVSKGYADFALIRKNYSDIDASRAALSALPHFPGDKPYRFLARKGVGYSRSGFLSSSEDAVVYRFQDVPIFDSAASDSTLLLIFDLIEACPTEQAIVISGDISASKFPDKLKTMSLFVGKRGKAPERAPYVWNPSDTAQFTFLTGARKDIASMEVEYRFPRPDRKLMATPQPLVTQMFVRDLSGIVGKRLRSACRAADIPLAGFSYRFKDASLSGSDERIAFRVSTAPVHIPAVTAELSRIIAHIDEQGVAMDEYTDMRDRIVSEEMRDAANKPVTNAAWVDRCVSAWLYGSHLASEAKISEFFARRSLTPEHEMAMFNRFCSALLSPSANLSVRYEFPSGTEPGGEELEEKFRSSWSYARLDTLDRVKYRVNYADTLSLVVPETRVRATRSVSEPITGGELWSFSNGMKVIFKKTSMKNEFRYGFLIRGGYPGVNGLLPGEAPFVADMLTRYEVAGMKGVDFRNMMRANGIVMNAGVTVSDLRITGTAPAAKFSLLMKSLLSLAGARTLDTENFEYFKSGEALRLSAADFTIPSINSVVDSIMCPEYIYHDRKSISSLRDDLPERAETYFSRQFRNCSDGVLVLIGDLDGFAVKKALCSYLGGFKTGRYRSTRPVVDYPMHTGWTTYTVDADGAGEPGVNVAVSAKIPFSMEKFMSFKIARMALERRIVRRLADVGMYAAVSEKVEILPAERMTIYVNCRQCDASGLPAGIVPADPLTALGAVRAAISEVSSSKIDASELKGYKAALLNRMSSDLSSSEELLRMVMVRYSEGKDLVSGYKEKVNAVTEGSVREILSALNAGGMVEYIVK